MASKLDVDEIAAKNGTDPVTLTKQYAAKVWLNYDASTNTVEDSNNVASVTDNSTGNFNVNYTNSMSNNTPAVTITTTDLTFCGIADKSHVTSSTGRVNTDNNASSSRDRNYNGYVVHGDLA